MNKINNIEREVKVKHKKRKNTLESSNFEFHLDTNEAFSYGWWKFSTIYKGKLIINYSSYSPSTYKHQVKACKILNKLDVHPSIVLKHTRKSLADIDEALLNEVNNIQERIEDLQLKINKKGSHKRTNKIRYNTISQLQVDLLKLVDFINYK